MTDDTPSSDLIALDDATRMLEQIATVEDAANLIDMAGAARDFAQKARLGTESVNHATAIKLKAERRLASCVRAGQESGEIATSGTGGSTGNRHSRNVRSTDISKPQTFDELGIDRRRVNESFIVLDNYSDAEIDEATQEANEQDRPLVHGAFIKKAHVSKTTGEHEWYTPSEYIEAARRVFTHDGMHDEGISLDPASSDKAQETVKAHNYFTAETDGLAQEWHGSVWLNPPYSQPLIGKFVAKLIEEWEAERVEEAIILVNNGTDTEWGQSLLETCTQVCFPRRRIKFLDPEGNPGAPLQGQMICYFGTHRDHYEVVNGDGSEYPSTSWFEMLFSEFGSVHRG